MTTPTMATDLVGMSQEDWQRALHPSHTALKIRTIKRGDESQSDIQYKVISE